MDLQVSFGLSILVCIGLNAAPAEVPYVYTETPHYEGGVDRFPRGATLQIVRHGVKTPLFRTFAASADASISFDARRIVFAGKRRTADPWQIWEGPLDGAPSQVTAQGESITPFYLPGGKIVYSLRTASGFQIEVISPDTRITHRLTFAPGDYLVCDVLRDGRILFAGPHPAGGGNMRDIYTIYSDGSGVETYRCDHRHSRAAGREISSGDIVFESGGRLARFTSVRAVEQPLPQPEGTFAGPVAEISPGEWLVSYRPDLGSPYALYRWMPPSNSLENPLPPGRGSSTHRDPATSRDPSTTRHPATSRDREGADGPRRILTPHGNSLVKLQSTPGAQMVQPVLVRPRQTPKRHPSGLGDRDGANLLCLNVYATNEPIRAGSVAAVRVWAQDGAGVAVALGQAPVAVDGSFFVQVPEDRPIRFELLDRAGKTAAAEHGWFWARRGEQRVCTGCHAGPSRAPENVVPDVLLHNPEPVRIMK